MKTMYKSILIAILFLSSCIYQEETPFKLIDGSEPEKPEVPIVIDPPCSYTNYAEIDDLFPPFKGTINYIEEDQSPSYYISGEIYNPPISGNFKMYFTNGRPKKNAIYTFTSGSVSPVGLSWTWFTGSISLDAYNGKIYVEVLPDKRVKFTWCSLTLDVAQFSAYPMSRGSFILD